MNRKMLMLTLTFLLISMMATSMVGTAQACRRRRTVETFYSDPASDPPTLSDTQSISEGDYKIVKDGTVRISWGMIKKSRYEGPLGSGYFTLETLIQKTNEPFMPVGEGWMICKYTLEIVDDGGYGTGTLRGGGFVTMEANLPTSFEMWSKGSMYGKLDKNGDLNRVTVFVNGYTCLAGVWMTKTTIIS
jgi:hypothetical protein